MNLIEVIADGFADVRMHAGRTALQTVGVVLGVASVVGTMGLTAGERQQALRFYTQSGGVLKVMVWPKQVETVRSSAREMASRGLTLDDVEVIRASIPGFDIVEPKVGRTLLIRSMRASKSYYITGVGPAYADLHELLVERGRFISGDDVATSATVCVLGADRAREFFGTEDAVGKNLRIGDHLFRIAGVLEYREFYWNKSDTYNALGWMNEVIIVPVTTMQVRVVGAGSRKIDEIGLRLSSVKAHDDSVPGLKRLLTNRHGADDFQVYDRQDRLQQMNQQGKVYDFTFLACGIISLVVGGIVVANIMLASFTERMREVGVRKALGAKGWHIFVQFLVESAIVTGLGGAVGLGIGIGFVHGIAYLLDQTAVLTPAMIVAAAFCAGSVSVIFGLYPALKAARLDPVVALRYE
ncbi:MAG TPA: ABC transporter permease [Thermoanaerobaculaceae bacterium]|nr:ABC transporter permease [Thermoanaerobaculaceae bacterium]